VKLPVFQPKAKPLNSKFRLLTGGVAHTPLASLKPTHFGRGTNQFNSFVNPKTLGLVACPPTLTGCSPTPRRLLNPVLKAKLLDFFPLLFSGQELPFGMFD
jgi:hypothetical protein